MNSKLRRFQALAIAVVLFVLSGCATKNPEWLSGPYGAFCATSIDEQCLKGFAEASYRDATARVATHRMAAAEDRAVTVSKELDEPKAVIEAVVEKQATQKDAHIPHSETEPDTVSKIGTTDERSTSPQSLNKTSSNHDKHLSAPENDEGSIPALAFGIAAIGATAVDAEGFTRSGAITQSLNAGAILHSGDAVTVERFKAAQSIPDEVLRSEVLSKMVTLYSNSMNDEQINAALNDLYALSKEQYTNALIVKLPSLLQVGDLERAAVLRSALLKSHDSSRAFSMLAYIASCYTMAGLKDDAAVVVRDAYRSELELTADDRKLVAMAINVGSGDYPRLQDFYDYKSDEVRLQAYLTLAVISRQLGRPDTARRAIGDAIRFIQKSSVKVDRQKSLGMILSLAPGLL